MLMPLFTAPLVLVTAVLPVMKPRQPPVTLHVPAFGIPSALLGPRIPRKHRALGPPRKLPLPLELVGPAGVSIPLTSSFFEVLPKFPLKPLLDLAVCVLLEDRQVTALLLVVVRLNSD